MQLEFTKEQFLQLMKLVHLGEFIVNGHSLIPDTDKSAREIKDILVQKAVSEEIKDCVEYYRGSQCWDYSSEKEREFYGIIQKYCSQDFYEEMIEILTQNMLRKKYGAGVINLMKPEKYEKLFSEMLEIVEKETDKNDYDNVVLDTK